MGKVVIRHYDEVEPTLFTGRESRRIITPERDNTTSFSVHRIHRYAGLSNPIKYPENDEALYVTEGEGYILEDDRKTPIRAGSCVFIPQGTTAKRRAKSKAAKDPADCSKIGIGGFEP